MCPDVVSQRAHILYIKTPHSNELTVYKLLSCCFHDKKTELVVVYYLKQKYHPHSQVMTNCTVQFGRRTETLHFQC